MRDLPIAENRFTWQLDCQWLDIFSNNRNWKTFTFFQFEVEDEVMMGTANTTIALFGFRLYLAYVYDTTQIEELKKWVKSQELDEVFKDSDK